MRAGLFGPELQRPAEWPLGTQATTGNAECKHDEFPSLQPSGDADRTALLRRLYFDLIGLPPTPEQTARFLGDASPLATERLVEVRDLMVFDFQTLPGEQFMQDGYIFGDGPRRAGDAYLDTSGEMPAIRFASHACALNDPIWNGLESLAETGVRNRSRLAQLPRRGRTLRTPTFELTTDVVACRVRGMGHVFACVDSHRLVAGPLHRQTVKPIHENSPWVELDRSHAQHVPLRRSRHAIDRRQGACDQGCARLSARHLVQTAVPASCIAPKNLSWQGGQMP